MNRSLLVVALCVTVGVINAHAQFCETENAVPNMDGVWICDPTWLLDVIPAAGKLVNLKHMTDGDPTTSAKFPSITTANRSLVFQLPEKYVLTSLKIKFAAPLKTTTPFLLSFWDDLTFDTYNRTATQHWLLAGHFDHEANSSVLKMNGYSQLSKYWKIDLPNSIPISIRDIAFKIKANLPHPNIMTAKVYMESMSGQQIDPLQLDDSVFQMNVAAAPTTHQCGTVQTPVPSHIVRRYRIDTSFYHKFTSAYGVPILTNYVVDDRALKRACYTVRFMLSDNKAIRDHMYANKGRVTIIGRRQGVTHAPEYRHLRGWTHRAAGGTYEIPVTVGAEENVLCERGDSFGPAQDILMHEFAHGVQLIAARTAIPDFTSRLQRNFLYARSQGKWRNTYANTNNIEYFAEATQIFFNQQRLGPRGGDGIQNDIHTRDKLRSYDYGLYKLVQEIYPCASTKFIHRCQDKTQERGVNQVFEMNCSGGGGGGGTGGGGSGCQDKKEHCNYWQGQGYCTSTQWSNYMTENCPKACNKCPATTTRATTTTTTLTTTLGNGLCTDLGASCDYWKQQNYCTSGEWVDWMATNCKKTCGKCAVTTEKLITPPPLTTTVGTLCEDKKENCNYWLGQGLCTSQQWGDYMTENCPKSCKKCGSVILTTTTTPTTTIPTTTTTSTSCEDQKENCNYWLDQGLCTSGKWVEWMAENCPKSCGKCGGGGGGIVTTTLLTPPPLSTTLSTTIKPTCTDTDERCGNWGTYCQSNEYVKTNCKQTCNTC